MGIVSRLQHDNRTVWAISTGLSAHAAAKSRLQRGKRASGYLITPEGGIHPWIPEGTFCRDDREDARVQHENSGILYIWGSDFDGVSLLEIITDTDTEAAWLAFHRCFTAIERAASSADPLGRTMLREVGQSGPEAILWSQDGSVLILPGEIYRRSLAVHGSTIERQNRLEWVVPDSVSETPERSFAFLVGTCAYRIASGSSPFMNENLWSLQKKAKETEDTFIARLIRYGFALPIQVLQPSLNDSLSMRINEAITARKPASATSILEFSNSFTNTEPSSTKNGKVQIQQRKAYEQKQITSLSRSIFFNKNKTNFLVAGIITAFVVIFTGMYISDIRSKPTTAGLEPHEVVTGFYNSIAMLDANTLKAYSKKKAYEEYDGLITTMYMTNRIRADVEGEAKMASPIELFTKRLDASYTIFGITNMTYSELQKKEDSAEYRVGFYLFVPEDLVDYGNEPKPLQWREEEPLAVYHYRDVCTLSRKKDRWIISDIRVEERSIAERVGTMIFSAAAEGSGESLPYAPHAED